MELVKVLHSDLPDQIGICMHVLSADCSCMLGRSQHESAACVCVAVCRSWLTCSDNNRLAHKEDLEGVAILCLPVSVCPVYLFFANHLEISQRKTRCRTRYVFEFQPGLPVAAVADDLNAQARVNAVTLLLAHAAVLTRRASKCNMSYGANEQPNVR